MSSFSFKRQRTVEEAREAFARLFAEGSQGPESLDASSPRARHGDPLGVVALACPRLLGLSLLDEALDIEFKGSDGFNDGDDLSESTVYRPAAGRTGSAIRLAIGLGSAHRIRLESRTPFVDAELEVNRLPLVCDVQLEPFVRFYGGGAFDARRSFDETCWREFGTATFLLPRLSYLETDSEAVILIASRASELTASLALAGRVLERAGSELTRDLERAPSSLRAVTLKESADHESWTKMLTSAQSKMRQGELSKVVAARRMTVQLSHAPTLRGVMDRLSEQAPGCHHFALRIGRRFFVGATPETLVEKQGMTLRTEALAGTLATGPEGPTGALEDQLLASGKDRSEHQFVVDSLRDVLAPLCDAVAVAPQPGIRSLKRMLHLWTPIHAHLSRPMHVLQLVTRLHPTPAVGGVPQQAALDFILEQEPAERGWYAAPFGFCGRDGNGHFLVSLRSALVADDKVHVYAGAGIVPESDPMSEYAETQLKMGSILGALGLSS